MASWLENREGGVGNKYFHAFIGAMVMGAYLVTLSSNLLIKQ